MWPIPVPEAARCECCAVGFESIVWRAHNSTPIFVSGDSLQATPLPSQKLLLTLLGEWCLPCQRVPDVDQTSGWPM